MVWSIQFLGNHSDIEFLFQNLPRESILLKPIMVKHAKTPQKRMKKQNCILCAAERQNSVTQYPQTISEPPVLVVEKMGNFSHNRLKVFVNASESIARKQKHFHNTKLLTSVVKPVSN